MNKKAVFLDVDGTIVANHQTISPKVKEAINQARKNGHKIFICTGRNKAGINQELKRSKFLMGLLLVLVVMLKLMVMSFIVVSFQMI